MRKGPISREGHLSLAQYIRPTSVRHLSLAEHPSPAQPSIGGVPQPGPAYQPGAAYQPGGALNPAFPRMVPHFCSENSPDYRIGHNMLC